MKLSASIDLAPKKAAAIESLNKYFDEQSKKVGSPVPQIHQAKLRYAQTIKTHGQATTPPALVTEAKRRGITTDALADLIVQKDADMLNALMELETRRQALIDQINAAASEKAIETIRNGGVAQ